MKQSCIAKIENDELNNHWINNKSICKDGIKNSQHTILQIVKWKLEQNLTMI